MKTRKLVLIIADFVLLALFIIQGILSSVDSTKTFELKETPDEVHIYNKNNQIDLISLDEGKTWLLGDNQYPANSYFVEDLIQKFRSITAISKVGNIKNEADIERFELDESNCVSVVAKKDGKVIRSIQIGKRPSGLQQVFATIDEKTDIYLVKGDLHSSFDYQEDYLRLKIIYNIDVSSIKCVKCTDSNGKVVEITDDVEKQTFAQFTTDTFELPEDLSETKKIYSIVVQAEKEITMDIYELKTGDMIYNQDGEPEPEIIYIGTSSESAYKFNVPAFYVNSLNTLSNK